jgi:hypothetical protein
MQPRDTNFRSLSTVSSDDLYNNTQTNSYTKNSSSPMAHKDTAISIMEKLPLELIHMICACLPTPDLGNFRLSSKDCAKVGESHIIRDLHVMFNAKSFRNLLQISKHPTLSKHVTSIFYEARFLEELGRKEWEMNIRDNERDERHYFEHGSDDGSELEVYDEETKKRFDKGWKAYKRMLEEQEYLQRTKYDFSVFAQALARFPGLKKIEMTSEYAPPSEHMVRAYADTLAIAGLMIDGGESDDEEVGVRALGSLFLALTALPLNLQELKARRVHWSFFNPAPKDLNLYRPVFSHLRHLDLILEADYDDIDEEDIVLRRQEELGLALQSATGLESLKLSFGDGDLIPQMVLMERQMNVPVGFAPLFRNMTWRNLKRLELCVVTGSETDFTSFFQRHARTLKKVKLHNMWLADNPAGSHGWDKVFKTMRRELILKDIDLRGVWGADGPDGRPKLMKLEGDFGEKLGTSILRGRNTDKENGKEKGKKGRKSSKPSAWEELSACPMMNPEAVFDMNDYP